MIVAWEDYVVEAEERMGVVEIVVEYPSSYYLGVVVPPWHY